MDSAIEAATKAVVDYTGQRLPPNGDVRTCEGIARAAIQAYLAAKEAEGFVMVPVEATAVMCQRGGVHTACVSPRAASFEADLIYRAMIAARPREEDR